jgi:ABC-2 type transport system ATP-binding protein
VKSAICVKNLKKSFFSNQIEIVAVDHLDLECKEGEIFGFLGPNGAGKTTTLRVLTTLIPPDLGDIKIAGFDLKNQSKEIRKNIGYVSQAGGSDPYAKGIEDLILQGKLHGLTYKSAKKRADELIDIFSLNDCISRLVKTYSGGQKRRLDIAISMMHKPLVLFLDEPTSGLDPQNRMKLSEEIKALKKEGRCIFLTSHYLDEVDSLSDRLAIMDYGRVVAEGTPSQLKKEISGDIITLGVQLEDQMYQKFHKEISHHLVIRDITKDENKLRLYVDNGESAMIQILRFLDAKSIPMTSLELSMPSLNDVFLKKTGRTLRDSES